MRVKLRSYFMFTLRRKEDANKVYFINPYYLRNESDEVLGEKESPMFEFIDSKTFQIDSDLYCLTNGLK